MDRQHESVEMEFENGMNGGALVALIAFGWFMVTKGVPGLLDRFQSLIDRYADSSKVTQEAFLSALDKQREMSRELARDGHGVVRELTGAIADFKKEIHDFREDVGKKITHLETTLLQRECLNGTINTCSTVHPGDGHESGDRR